jgi:hypothetical protein
MLIKIVHNPGNIPDLRLVVDANVTVVCDMSWEDYLQVQPELLALTSLEETNAPSRQDLSYMINQVPSAWRNYDVDDFVMGLLQGAGWIFVTDSNMGSSPSVSQGWGYDWESFVNSMWLNPRSRT